MPQSRRHYAAAKVFGGLSDLTRIFVFGPFPERTLVDYIRIHIASQCATTQAISVNTALRELPTHIAADTTLAAFLLLGRDLMPGLASGNNTLNLLDVAVGQQAQSVLRLDIPVYYEAQGDYPFLGVSITETSGDGSVTGAMVAPLIPRVYQSDSDQLN